MNTKEQIRLLLSEETSGKPKGGQQLDCLHRLRSAEK